VKILVRATNWVGDVVMSIPAVRALRASFPKAELLVLARPWVADLYRLLPEVDRVVVEDARGAGAGRAGRERLVKELRALRIDRAVCLPTSFGTAWTLFRARIPERIGYAAELRTPLLTRAVPRPAGGLGPPRGYGAAEDGPVASAKNQTAPAPLRPSPEHQVWKHLRLAEAAGAGGPDRLDVTLPVSEALLARACALLAGSGRNEEPFVAAHVASFAHAAKRWDLERFGAVFEALAARGLTIVLLGTASEAAVNAEAARLAPSARILDLSGKSTLPEALAILRLARAFLGNDSGLAHLAAAAGTPVVVVFGPTDPEATRPLGIGEGGTAPVDVVRQPPLCAPCRFRICPIDHRCMRDVTKERVVSTLNERIRP
jgi:heptosyltransferase-2